MHLQTLVLFGIFSGIFGGHPAPPAVIGCVIQDRDFSRGPRVEKKDWNVACILEADVTSLQLANVSDPARFLNARAAHLNKPTQAVFINADGSTSPLWPLHLISLERASVTRDKLRALFAGTSCTVEPLSEMSVSDNPRSRPDWRGETRRPYMVGRSAVALAARVYASDVKERAEARLRSEQSLFCVERRE